MTDRIHSLTVVLNRDIREDDVEPLINAIRMIKGVLTVDKHVADISDHMAEMRAIRDLEDKIFSALRPELYKNMKDNR